MTIWISRVLPLFNFERLDILCTQIGHPSEKLWPFEFLESFHYSVLSVSVYYPPESDIRVIISDHLNFSRASVVQFRATWNIMGLIWTSEWKVITICISRELALFNFERLDMLCAWIGHPSEKLWPFEFLESFRCSFSSVSIYFVPKSDIPVKSYDHLNLSGCSVAQFRASRYIMRLNQKPEWKVMTIRISRELPLFNFERLDVLWDWIEHPSETLCTFEFLESFCFPIPSVSICYGRESNIRVKSNDHFEFLDSFSC